VPAIVLTVHVVTPPEEDGEISRMVQYGESVTKRFPLPSTAIPTGPENRAIAPIPSEAPLCSGAPAKVVTVQVVVVPDEDGTISRTVTLA
jgi:hypothetical protein